MAQRASQGVMDGGSALPSGLRRGGATLTSERQGPLSQGRTVLYATRPKPSAQLIRATTSGKGADRQKLARNGCSEDLCHFPGGDRGYHARRTSGKVKQTSSMKRRWHN